MTATTGEPDDKIMNKRGPALKVKTKHQNQLIWMIFAAMAIPTLVLGGSMFLMIARLSAPNTGVSPHEVIVGIMGYVAVLFPLSIAALLYWAFHGTCKMVGPIERITQELDQCIEGQKSGPIVLRPGDHLIPLVDKINGLLEERENFKTVKNLDQPAVNHASGLASAREQKITANIEGLARSH